MSKIACPQIQLRELSGPPEPRELLVHSTYVLMREKALQVFNMGRVWTAVESGVCLWEILSDSTVRTEASVGWNPKEHRCARWNPGWVSTGGSGSAQHWGTCSVGASTDNFVVNSKLQRVKGGPLVPELDELWCHNQCLPPPPQTCPKASLMITFITECFSVCFNENLTHVRAQGLLSLIPAVSRIERTGEA